MEKFLLSINTELLGLIIFIFFVASFLYLFIVHNFKNKDKKDLIKKLNNDDIKFLVNDKEVSLKEYLKVDPHFKEDVFQYITFEVFRHLQYAWSSFDYDQIKKITPLSTWSEYVAKLDEFKKRGHQHIIRDLSLIDSKINYISINDYEQFAELYFSTTCYNYLLATFTNRVIGGSNENKYLIDYKVTVKRLISDETPIKKKTHCENCSTNITNVKESICPNCSYMIIPENYIFQIVKKEVVKEKYMD